VDVSVSRPDIISTRMPRGSVVRPPSATDSTQRVNGLPPTIASAVPIASAAAARAGAPAGC
jgi:hypothetical protein